MNLRNIREKACGCLCVLRGGLCTIPPCATPETARALPAELVTLFCQFISMETFHRN